MVVFEVEEDAEEPVKSEEDVDSEEEEDQPSVEFVDLRIPTYISYYTSTT